MDEHKPIIRELRKTRTALKINIVRMQIVQRINNGNAFSFGRTESLPPVILHC